jgi:diguanylate cyclase (GGDEF)-like protein
MTTTGISRSVPKGLRRRSVGAPVAVPERAHRWPRGVRAAIALLVVGNCAYAAHVAFGFPGAGSYQLWNTWVYDSVYALAVLLCLARAISGRDRLVWGAAGLALLAFLLGEIYWDTTLAGMAEPPFPSWADAGYLAFYPLIVVAVVVLLRSHGQRPGRSVWLDGGVAALALAGVASTVVLDPVVTATHGDLAAAVTSLSYPILDVLLLGLVAGCLVLLGRAGGRPWLLLALGLFLNGATNTVYLYQSATGSYREGGWLDAGWPIAAALVAVAAWASRGSRRAPPARPGDSERWGEALMWTFAVPIAGVMLLDTFHPIPVAAHAILTLAVVALLARLGLALSQRGALARARGREARTDELTRLANRRRLYEAADAALADGRPVAMLLLDLNRFKELNDTLGHNAGDDLLRLVSERLRAVVPRGGLLARMGGDEFVLMLDGVAEEGRARDAAEALHDALEEPFPVDGLRIPVRASIGIGLAPLHSRARPELLRCADVAMYRAKTRRTGVEIYTPRGDGYRRAHLELVSELREAIASGQLVLHYQPKLALRDGRLVGVEALVRWQHPRLGLLPPAEFIGLAEREGLMRGLTLAVLDLALAQQQRWRKAGRAVPVAVNLSADSLLDRRLPNDIEASMARHGTGAGELELEITEGTLLLEPSRALDVIARISELGVSFSLDDFGTGYSSLAQLRRLPVRYLKIDRSFIQSMSENPEDASIVRSTIGLAHSLRLGVVAEGVETEAHLRELADWGCDVAQGFHLGRPCPAEQLFAPPGPGAGDDAVVPPSPGGAAVGGDPDAPYG